MTTLKIERDATLGANGADGEAGFGALETGQGRLPLTAMDVRAQISGLIAQITVAQTFHNSLDAPLEATYIFPLPDRAAVIAFRLQVGERIIEADLKERSQARADYDAAISQGFRAAIAEEERSGTFNLRVGNIPPQQSVNVKLTLVGPLPVADGEATFRFPLVVAPRYVPGVPLDGPSVGAGYGHDTDQVPDASRVTPPVLLPGFPNPVRLSLQVQLDSVGRAASTSAVRSSLHTVVVESNAAWTIRLEPGERLNRDFILRIPLVDAEIQSVLQVGPMDAGNASVIGLTLVPPAVVAGAPTAPRDVVVLLDRSGSMSGWKMVAARRAVGRLIDTLRDHDRFTLLAFDSDIEYAPHARSALVPASDQNRWKALEWLGRIDARGGTELGPALQNSVQLLAHSDRARQPVIIVVTDGQVAGEDAVLGTLQQAADSRMPRIHTLGIDRAVNHGFLQRLADLGQGTCDVVESEGRLDEAMDHIHRAVATPALTQLRLEPIDWKFESDSVAPQRLPDLFADRPVMIFGRCRADLSTLRLRVHGVDAAGCAWQQEVDAQRAPMAMLQSLWGRAKVRELEDQYAADGRHADGLQKRIVDISLSAGVLSRFTAFVAVDRSQVVHSGGPQHQIVQPVEMPEGWDNAPVAGGGSMRHCCLAADEVSVVERALPYRSKMRMERKSSPLARTFKVPQPRTIALIIAELRQHLQRLTETKLMRLRSFAKQVDRIGNLLEELSTTLELEHRNQDASLVEKRVREVHEKYRDKFMQRPRTLDEATRKKFAAEIVAILEVVESASAPATPERASFWT